MKHQSKERGHQAKPDAILDLIPIDNIKPRTTDLRRATVEGVLTLAENMAKTEQIDPIVVDCHFRLIDGLSRWAAAKLLITPPEKRWESIEAIGVIDSDQEKRLDQLPGPEGLSAQLTQGFVLCRVYPQLDSETQQLDTFRIEISANANRQKYTREEVLKVVKRLEGLGFGHALGRPAHGRKRLKPELMLILGISDRHATRLLTEIYPDKARKRKFRHTAEFPRVVKKMRKDISAWKELGTSENPYAGELNKQKAQLQGLLDASIESEDDPIVWVRGISEKIAIEQDGTTASVEGEFGVLTINRWAQNSYALKEGTEPGKTDRFQLGHKSGKVSKLDINVEKTMSLACCTICGKSHREVKVLVPIHETTNLCDGCISDLAKSRHRWRGIRTRKLPSRGLFNKKSA